MLYLVNRADKTSNHLKESKTISCLISQMVQVSNCKWIKYLNVKHKNVKYKNEKLPICITLRMEELLKKDNLKLKGSYI